MTPRRVFDVLFRRPTARSERRIKGPQRVRELRAAARSDAGLPGDRAPQAPLDQEDWSQSVMSMFEVPRGPRIDISLRAPSEALISAHRVMRRRWEITARRACGFSAGLGVLIAMLLCLVAASQKGAAVHGAVFAATLGAFLVALSASGIAVALSRAIETTDRRSLEEVDVSVQRRVYRICGLNPIARRYVDDVIAQGRLLTRLEVTELFSWWSRRHVKFGSGSRAGTARSEGTSRRSAVRSPRAEHANLMRSYR